MEMKKIKQYLFLVIFICSVLGQGIFHSHGFFNISGPAHHFPEAAEQKSAPLKVMVCIACLAERNPSHAPVIPHLAGCRPLQALVNPLLSAPAVSSPRLLLSPRSPPTFPA